MRLGISSYTYTWAIGVPGYDNPKEPMTAVGLLEKAAGFGINLVQIADNLPLDSLTDNELNELRQTARELNMALEVGTRGCAPDLLRRYLDIARYLDAQLLRTLLHAPGSTPTLAEAATWIESIVPELEEADVVLAIENHDRYQARELADLVRRVGSSSVGICLDTVNSFGALEGPEYVLNELGPYVNNLHFKDFTIERVNHMMGFDIRGAAAGTGRLNATWLLNTMQKLDKDPNLILELWTPYSGTMDETIAKESDWARQSVDYLKKILA